jgi:hypothetical protein
MGGTGGTNGLDSTGGSGRWHVPGPRRSGARPGGAGNATPPAPRTGGRAGQAGAGSGAA